MGVFGWDEALSLCGACGQNHHGVAGCRCNACRGLWEDHKNLTLTPRPPHTGPFAPGSFGSTLHLLLGSLDFE